MRSEHSSFSGCRYPEIFEILHHTDYFGEEDGPCSCILKKCVYSREWDYEYNEYYSRTLFGIDAALGILKGIVENPEERNFSEEIKRNLASMKDSERERIKGIIDHFPLKEISNHISRISLYTKEGREPRYLGFVDLSPFGVSEVYIRPPLWMTSPHYYLPCERIFFPDTALRLKENSAEMVSCVPFIKVQAEVAVCAQYAVRMALMILSQRPPTVPEIVFEASKTALKGGLDRHQEDGWYDDEIKQAIEDKGYGVHELGHCEYIRCEECGAEFNLNPRLKSPDLENIYAYVESGIPVILGIKDTSYLPWWPDETEGEAHAIVAIGHTISDDNRIDGLIVHDESTYPYQVLYEVLDNGTQIEDMIDSAIIPVPREVVVEYPVAKGIFNEIIGHLQENGILRDILYRPILVDAHHAKRMLGEEGKRAGIMDCTIPVDVRDAFLSAYMGRYVWLFELRYDTGDEHYEYTGDILIGTKDPVCMGMHVPEAGIYAYYEDERAEGLTFNEYSDDGEW
ncbi:hypothetical protein E2N92_05620 [Methanofollis formosanus]|uniref:Uncharacterized protein n=1 Tax=Methanofollis formosanus TaxID=299308 RepID=A0A8G1A213_9EURY|nr:C39 family peptidase [Methanofollis formosanus]QYZ78939.1 hypothetical protein E2N92_05620 [Methanofollis formosanus]